MSTPNTLSNVKITNRIEACTCGCNGSDSWHKATYPRTIRNISVETGTARTMAGTTIEFGRVGYARFPWCTRPVKVIQWTLYTERMTNDDDYYARNGWYIDYEDNDNDRY